MTPASASGTGVTGTSVTAPGAVSPVGTAIGRPAERLRHAEHVMGTVSSFDIPAPAAAVLPEVVSGCTGGRHVLDLPRRQ